MVTAASTWYGPPPRPSPPIRSLAVNVPLRKAFQLRQHHPLAVVEEALHRVQHRPGAVAPEEFEDARLPDPVRGDPGPEVAERLVGEADVGADQLDERAVDLAAVHELHERELEALLVDLG